MHSKRAADVFPSDTSGSPSLLQVSIRSEEVQSTKPRASAAPQLLAAVWRPGSLPDAEVSGVSLTLNIRRSSDRRQFRPIGQRSVSRALRADANILR